MKHKQHARVKMSRYAQKLKKL
uniref:Uncharacterized protein n=1 Tax=Rhizophora mucronata TaxID=61149 RepID=A0A2P2NJR9_RHIMU